MRDQDLFWSGVDEGKLLFQKCRDCGTVRNPPGPMCPNCQSLNAAPHESNGRGTVCAWIISKHPTRPDENHRIVALIEMEDGVRMVSNLREIDFADVTPGLPVELFFAEVGGAMLPQFRPSASV